MAKPKCKYCIAKAYSANGLCFNCYKKLKIISRIHAMLQPLIKEGKK